MYNPASNSQGYILRNQPSHSLVKDDSLANDKPSPEEPKALRPQRVCVRGGLL